MMVVIFAACSLGAATPFRGRRAENALKADGPLHVYELKMSNPTEKAIEEMHVRLTETMAGNRRLLDKIAFEEACSNKLKRELGMSTLLHISPLDRLAAPTVASAPGGASAADDLIENVYVQMHTRLQAELSKRSELERRVRDAQNLTTLLTAQRG
jgi:hypothetical protein